jgi:hypothetical protein
MTSDRTDSEILAEALDALGKAQAIHLARDGYRIVPIVPPPAQADALREALERLRREWHDEAADLLAFRPNITGAQASRGTALAECADALRAALVASASQEQYAEGHDDSHSAGFREGYEAASQEQAGPDHGPEGNEGYCRCGYFVGHGGDWSKHRAEQAAEPGLLTPLVDDRLSVARPDPEMSKWASYHAEHQHTEDGWCRLNHPAEQAGGGLDGATVVRLLHSVGNTLAGWIREMDGYDDAALARAIDFVLRYPDPQERIAAARLQASAEPER